MCTAIRLGGAHPVFGRTLDYEFTYGEEVVLTPRGYPLGPLGVPSLCSALQNPRHYAILGMAHLADGIPLYYDAVNEHGLAIAGLNFVGNAAYAAPTGKDTDCPIHALIPTLLAYAKTVDEALSLIKRLTLVSRPFRDDYPIAELHFILADQECCAVIEPMDDGLHVYENTAHVLTNNPPFPTQLASLLQYERLSPLDAPDTPNFYKSCCASIPFNTYTKGRGAMGLPGDFTSTSRFIRAALCRAWSTQAKTEDDALCSLFHLLDTVSIPEGIVRTEAGCDVTQYACGMTLRCPSYTYTTRTNRRLCRIRLSDFPLDGTEPITFALHREQDILKEQSVSALVTHS